MQSNTKKIFEKYKTANSFSLTGHFNTIYDKEHPYGINKLDIETAEKVSNKIYESTLERLNNRYLKWSSKDKRLHPDFIGLINKIKMEVKEHQKRFLEGKILDEESPYMCDVFMMGKTIIKEPSDLWHFYNEIGMIEETYGPIINALLRNTQERDIHDVFNNPYYGQLRSSFLRTEITFSWGLTKSSNLSVVYYFKIDDRSIQWLNQLIDEFDMKELEDLALYNQGKLIMASVTHERIISKFGN